jgi:hypothetical protein
MGHQPFQAANIGSSVSGNGDISNGMPTPGV